MKSISIALVILGTALFSQPSPILAQHTFSSEQSLCTGILTAQSRSARINLRSGPSTDYQSRGYGLVGDLVYVLSSSPPEADYKQDKHGYIWYRVGFPGSGAKGWIREDLIELKCSYD